MKACILTVFGIAMLVCCITATHSDDLHKRIVNGEEVTSRAYTHQASLQIYKYEKWNHICGASIIGETKLLTAAHCFSEENDEEQYAVLLGTLNLDDIDESAQFIRVRTFKRHPGFEYNVELGYPNDIATIHLESPIEFNDHVQPAKLAPKGSSFVGKTCVMIGWGLNYGNRQHPHLMQAHITKITVSECYDRMLPTGATISRNHICVFEETDDRHDRSTICDGDSGGPLMCGEDLEFVAGVVSWTDVTCTGKIPAVYTRVSQYLEWIASTNPPTEDFVYTAQMKDLMDSFIQLKDIRFV